MTTLTAALFSIARAGAGNHPVPRRRETAVRLVGESCTVVYEYVPPRPAPVATDPDSPAFSDPGNPPEFALLGVYGDRDDDQQYNLLTWYEVNYPGLIERELWEVIR